MSTYAYMVLCAILFIFFVSWVVRRIRNNFYYNYPPGPKGWPLIGNMLNFDMARVHLEAWDHRVKYGDVSHVSLSGFHIVLLNSIDAVRHAMIDDNFKIVMSGRMKSFLSEYYLPDSLLLAPYGNRWAKLRRLVHSTLTQYARDTGRIEKVITEEIEELKCQLEKFDGQLFEIESFLCKSISNIIFVLIMGNRFHYNHDIHQCYTLADIKLLEMFGPATNGLLTLFPPLRHIPIGPGKVFQDLSKYLEKMLYYLYHSVDKNDIQDKIGFLYELLREKSKNTWLTDGDIHDALVDIMIGGVSTTTKSLYTFFFYMLHRPDVQKRIQKEIDDVVGRNRLPCLDDQPNMPYTRAVILETFRYSTFLPVVGAHSTMDDVVFRQFRLKKDTIIIPNIWLIHRDEEFWDEPWTFNPERFLDGEGHLHPPEHDCRKNLITFGLGKRRCVGELFARNRVFLFVTNLCQKFFFYTDHPGDLPDMDPRSYDVKVFSLPKSYKIQLKVR